MIWWSRCWRSKMGGVRIPLVFELDKAQVRGWQREGFESLYEQDWDQGLKYRYIDDIRNIDSPKTRKFRWKYRDIMNILDLGTTWYQNPLKSKNMTKRLVIHCHMGEAYACNALLNKVQKHGNFDGNIGILWIF